MAHHKGGFEVVRICLAVRMMDTGLGRAVDVVNVGDQGCG